MNSEYTGTDNLEIMVEAVNYNNYLQKLVTDRVKPGDCVLDFGAGIGTFAELLSKKDVKVICIEPDINQIAELERKGFESYQDIADVPDQKFDFIYSLNVLEHIEDDQEVLRQLYGKLKLGGQALFYVPAMQILFSSMDVKVGHFRRYSLSLLQQRVKQSGFQLLEGAYVDSLGFFATLLYKMIGNKKGDINLKTLIVYDRFLFPLSLMFDNLLHHWIGKNTYVHVSKVSEK